MAEQLGVSEDSEVREDLVYVRAEDGSYRGWRVELLVETLSSKVEEQLLLCSCCKGLLKDACLYQEEFRCRVCIPEDVAWQPVKMNREIVNDKMISCPLKRRGCVWSDTLSTALHHLEECEFFPELCPLGCVSLEGERKGKVVKLERRLIQEHQRDSCPLRELLCEFCLRKVTACQMNPHLEDCEDFPVPCPNGCVTEGEEGTRQLKRRHVPVHLTDECPLQKVQCTYWDHGCREEMERRETDLHEREFMHIHYRLAMTEMKQKLDRATDIITEVEQKQIETSKQMQDKLDWTTGRIAFLENESKMKELSEVKQKQIETSNDCKQMQDKLDRATGGIAFLENENESKMKELSEIKHKQIETSKQMQDKLDTANNRIENLEKQITEKDLELKSVTEILYSYTVLPTGQLEWKIQGVKQKIQNKEYTYSDPFYLGLYKCQGCIVWNYENTGKVGVCIYIMKGESDDKLHWPITYKYTFILLNHINSKDNYVYSNQITNNDLEKYPNCFKRPTEMTNKGFGYRSFISNTEILEKKYCKGNSITLQISVELLPFF